VEHTYRRPIEHKPGGLTASGFANIEWVIANHGSITIGEVGADVGCVAAAADTNQCYAMLARRDCAIESAAKSGTTIDEINPPGGFKPAGRKSRRP